MGLDMYLKGRRYLWSKKDEEMTKTLTGVFPEASKYDMNYVGLELAYWRKANAIHSWFVQNVQNGIDECQESYVDISQLEELIDVCKRVLNDPNFPTLGKELLPTASGFFFGSTEYDIYYKQDLEQTIEALEKIIDDCKEGGCLSEYEIMYQSSW